MLYFTDLSITGRVRQHQLPSGIGVTDQPGSHVLIGSATEVGQTQYGEVLWSLRVHDAAVQGRWVIVDGMYMTDEEEPVPG
jgi:hypothetical protein